MWSDGKPDLAWMDSKDLEAKRKSYMKSRRSVVRQQAEGGQRQAEV